MLKSHFNLRPDDSGEQEETVEEEQASEAAEEEKVVHPVRKLNRFEVCGRLSLLGKTAEGDGYTYLKAKCTGMSLTDISGLKYYKHLQFVDVSDNHLDLDALQVLTDLQFLVLIHADKNILHSAALKKMKYLQVIIMNYNLITSVHDIYQPELSTLEVGYNKIERVSFDNRMPNIKCLDFRYNTIEDISNLDFPKLDSLYLAGNKITSLVGIERLVNLRILHIRYNPIKSLNGFDACLAKLQYINLRNCKIASLKQVKKLKVLTALDTLVMKGCPYMGGSGEENADLGNEEEDTEVRIEVLAALPRLKRINKGVVTPEERAEAKDLMMQWLEEGDKDEEEIDEEINEQESNAD
ncbi:leucine-rich repeat-containing protein 23-like isoform X1 [Achroia grisella]|uniref:leucine-rich repeat-containing protein 23-like isoform X1 n=1 Tax=Achroia grisella TaxID=688607 RepID=UPI0027D2C906|nr:leucine-rich repeat-containing protein 23-like isoform X1 [Achroia grisella]XP_059060684.1 leucine-rich repeat-containing protein 23-like isoform X1 [Achroia grisella]